MEKDLLQAVIKVESEIQQAIESERVKAAEWLESVRTSQSREFEIKKQQLSDQFEKSLSDTSRECRLKAENDIISAHQMAEHLMNLPEDIRQQAVSKFLVDILPDKQR